ncbi:MAG: holo-[acyl-carrier-protein] synthase [Myxococcales bacterium]
MIAGVGLDVVDIGAFSAQLADGASTLSEGTFTPAERRDAARGEVGRHLAARFAAKEAFVKAWSSANWAGRPALTGVDLREIEVVTDGWGRPALRLHGRVAGAVEPLLPLRLHVSLSHDGPVAVAVVVMERTGLEGAR